MAVPSSEETMDPSLQREVDGGLPRIQLDGAARNEARARWRASRPRRRGCRAAVHLSTVRFGSALDLLREVQNDGLRADLASSGSDEWAAR